MPGIMSGSVVSWSAIVEGCLESVSVEEVVKATQAPFHVAENLDRF